MMLMGEFEADSEHKLSLPQVFTKLEHIQDDLREITANLHESIEVIESNPLQKVWLDAEVKAVSLEEEVKRLREDLKEIKELLGFNLEKKKAQKS